MCFKSVPSALLTKQQFQAVVRQYVAGLPAAVRYFDFTSSSSFQALLS